QEIAAAAAAKGITVGVENHGTLLGRSAQIARIVALVDRPNFGVNLDFTNFRLVFGEDHVAATRALAPKVVHVHAKDLIFSSEPMPGEGWFEAPCGGYCKRAVGGEGEARWPEVFRILKDAGYDGTLSLEIADPADIKGSVVKGVANIRRTIAEIGAS
ncbi:MAG: sugar phosphate isomerase/epimerase, partial [Armatimonadetes bacterium]|nr:sugar phosphate isomerase/epimerase [Armatimonadota bacterium]